MYAAHTILTNITNISFINKAQSIKLMVIVATTAAITIRNIRKNHLTSIKIQGLSFLDGASTHQQSSVCLRAVNYKERLIKITVFPSIY